MEKIEQFTKDIMREIRNEKMRYEGGERVFNLIDKHQEDAIEKVIHRCLFYILTGYEIKFKAYNEMFDKLMNQKIEL